MTKYFAVTIAERHTTPTELCLSTPEIRGYKQVAGDLSAAGTVLRYNNYVHHGRKDPQYCGPKYQLVVLFCVEITEKEYGFCTSFL
jgi:hypothetical protein